MWTLSILLGALPSVVERYRRVYLKYMGTTAVVTVVHREWWMRVNTSWLTDLALLMCDISSRCRRRYASYTLIPDRRYPTVNDSIYLRLVVLHEYDFKV